MCLYTQACAHKYCLVRGQGRNNTPPVTGTPGKQTSVSNTSLHVLHIAGGGGGLRVAQGPPGESPNG